MGLTNRSNQAKRELKSSCIYGIVSLNHIQCLLCIIGSGGLGSPRSHPPPSRSCTPPPHHPTSHLHPSRTCSAVNQEGRAGLGRWREGAAARKTGCHQSLALRVEPRRDQESVPCRGRWDGQGPQGPRSVEQEVHEAPQASRRAWRQNPGIQCRAPLKEVPS